MPSPIEFTITVDIENHSKRHIEKVVRGYLNKEGYDAYVDTVNLPDDKIEVTVAVSSPQEGKSIRQWISKRPGVTNVS